MAQRGGGRGWYYKQKYGGGRGGGRGGHDASGGACFKCGQLGHFSRDCPGVVECFRCGSATHLSRDCPTAAVEDAAPTEPMAVERECPQCGLVFHDGPCARKPARRSSEELQVALERLDGSPYGGYKQLKGAWAFPAYTLHIDRVQSDPFAPPSQFRVQIPHAVARFPPELFSSKIRAVALADYLARGFARYVRGEAMDEAAPRGGWHGPKGGDVGMVTPSTFVLERTALTVTADHVEARFTVALPARGRSILGRQAADIVCRRVDAAVLACLRYDTRDAAAVAEHVLCVEDQQFLRDALAAAGLVAFVANGSVLPRKSGVSDQALANTAAVPFTSPADLEREFIVPTRGVIKGMGVPSGVTVIIGGGFHGKSTLLEALQLGVYNKAPRDGREFVVTDPSAVKIRAEDGRAVTEVDISSFIAALPHGRSSRSFHTTDASGSTSQAANIAEALEVGAKTLLFDEDTCATNFMIRDRRMQLMVPLTSEPIRPFITRVRQLYVEQGISSILVMGGCGDYFDVADLVLLMETFHPRNVTEQARRVAAELPGPTLEPSHTPLPSFPGRFPDKRSLQCSVGEREKVSARSISKIAFGEEEIDLSAVEQLVEIGQTRAIGEALLHARDTLMGPDRSVAEIASVLDAAIEARGLDTLTTFVCHNLARPRRHEIVAALNRLRTLRVIVKGPPPLPPA